MCFENYFYHEINFKTAVDNSKTMSSPKNDWYLLFHKHWQKLFGIFTYIIKSNAHWIPNRHTKCCVPLAGSLWYLGSGSESKPWLTKMQVLSRMEGSSNIALQTGVPATNSHSVLLYHKAYFSFPPLCFSTSDAHKSMSENHLI